MPKIDPWKFVEKDKFKNVAQITDYQLFAPDIVAGAGLNSFFHNLKYILIINTLHKTKHLKKKFFVPFLSRYTATQLGSKQ